jgi:hypothetical protein
VLILFEWDSLDGARQFVSSEELRDTMKDAGVADQPDFFFIEKVDQSSA